MMTDEHAMQGSAVRPNGVKKRLRQGEPTFGSWLTIPHAVSAEIMASVGYDWLMVDFEHAPLDIKDGLAMIQAMRYSPVAPLARIPMIDIAWIKKTLDMGFMGVLVPLVSTREDAALAVRLAKYPPEGVRGVAASHRAAGYGAHGLEYIQRANQETMVIIQIETADSVANVKEILSVRGVDCLFIGPMDLSTAMGAAGDFQNPRYVDALRRVEEAAREAHIPLGIFVRSTEDASQALEKGYQFFGISNDAAHLARSARKDIESIARMREAWASKR